MRARALAALATVAAVYRCSAAETVDITRLPPAASITVDFNKHIRPLFEATCFQCHGPEKPKSKFRLDQEEEALKGGRHGIDIIPGDSARSPLIHYVARLVEDLEMPPE